MALFSILTKKHYDVLLHLVRIDQSWFQVLSTDAIEYIKNLLNQKTLFFDNRTIIHEIVLCHHKAVKNSVNQKDIEDWNTAFYNILKLFTKHFPNSLNIKDSLGATPMHYAVKSNDINMVKWLCKLGANPHEQYYCDEFDTYVTPIEYAAYLENTEAIKAIHNSVFDLLIYWPYDGNTYLHRSLLVEKINPDVVNLMLEYCTSNIYHSVLNRKNNDGQTALEISVKKESIECIKILLKTGANVNIQNDITDEIPLHVSVKEGNFKISKLLLHHKSNPSAQDKNGKTPLHYAYQNDDQQLIELLIKYGANQEIKDDEGNTPEECLQLQSKLEDNFHSLFHIIYNTHPLNTFKDFIEEIGCKFYSYFENTTE